MPETPWPPAPEAGPATLGGPATPAPRPAPETARLVQFSCQRLLVVEPDFAAAFHSSLCELAPELALSDLPAGRQLSGAVAHCVLWAALTRDPADKVEHTVRGFAADHHGRGYPDGAYGCLCHALLRSARAVLFPSWSSQLSSGWVSYSMWLQPHLQAGARAAVGVGRDPAEPEAEISLDVILEDLRAGHFAGQDRALEAVSTRIMLRTGVDLRDPRPEQRHDPLLVAQVLKNLLLMGYAPGPTITAAAAARGAAAREALAPALSVAGAGMSAAPGVGVGAGRGRSGTATRVGAPGGSSPRPRPWWSRRRRG